MALSGKIINISSTNANSSTPLGINGRHRTLPHNEDVAVSDAELETLENSNVTFEVVGDAKAADLKNALDQGGGTTGAEPETPAGADNLNHPDDLPAIAIPLVPAENPTPAGADNLSSDSLLPDPAQARREAEDARAASIDGTIEPAVVLNNAPLGADQTEGTGATGAAAFDADAALDGSIPSVEEKLDTFDKDQLRAMLEAERAGKNRAGMIGLLESELEAS